MEPIIIFNKKYYPVMEDYTDEKGITKKAPFIQIGETMVRVVKPRKVGDKFWQHLQGSDVKVKKKTDFGTVVENYIQLATKGYEQNFVQYGKMYDSDFQAKMDINRKSLKPYKDAMEALNIDEVIDVDKSQKPREKFTPLDQKRFLQKYEKEIEGFKKSIKRTDSKKGQKEIFDKIDSTVFRFFQGSKTDPKGFEGMQMTPQEFGLVYDKEMPPEQKIEKMEEFMRPVKEEFNRLSEEQYREAGKEWKATAWMSMMGVIRPFMQRISGVTIGRRPAESPFSQDRVRAGHVGKYADLVAEPDQIKFLKECLERDDPTKTALFVFLIGLEMGLRNEELFSISAMPIAEGKSGIKLLTAFEKPTYELSIRTRKGDWHGVSFHKGIVQDPTLVKLIQEREKQVKDGIAAMEKNSKLTNKQLLKEYGIVRTSFDPHTRKDIPVRDHALVGSDNEFYQVTQLQDKKISFAKTAQTLNGLSGSTNHKNLQKLFVKCYREAGLVEDYWSLRPFHSIRHIFAHYWLRKTNFNYEQVAKQGHWGATTELKRSYGQLPNELFYADVVSSFDNPDLTIKELVEKKSKGRMAEVEAAKQVMQDEVEILSKVEAKKDRLA